MIVNLVQCAMSQGMSSKRPFKKLEGHIPYPPPMIDEQNQIGFKTACKKMALLQVLNRAIFCLNRQHLDIPRGKK